MEVNAEERPIHLPSCGFVCQLRDHQVHEANLEVEVRKVSLEKESISRGLSLSMDDLPNGSNPALQSEGDPFNCSAPETPGGNDSIGSGLTSPHGEWDADDEEDGWAALLLENRKLKAELKATQYLAATEMKKRAALEREVERLRNMLPLAELEVKGEEPLEDVSATSLVVKGEETTVNDRGEVALMVLKDQLSDLHHNNPGFQTMWGPSRTPFKVRGRTYMKDGFKVDAKGPLFELIHMEIFDVETGSRLPRADNITAMLKNVSKG